MALELLDYLGPTDTTVSDFELLEVICIACFHPMKAFPCGKSDKRPYRIAPYKVQGIDKFGNYVYTGCKGDDSVTTDFVEVPCGHCSGCRADQALEWKNRLVMESKYHDSMYFITLTYDELHLRRVSYTNELTGEIKNDRGTLSKRDVQLFIKRLRKQRPNDQIRYYLVGEYGPQTDRPHYHAIIFGLHLGDWRLVESGHSETGNTYYTCGELERIWGNGFVSIEPANEFTCSYVAQYVTKKLGSKPAAAREARRQEPEFSLQSRRPGIGRLYYEENAESMFAKGRSYVSTNNGSIEVRPPRYFKKLYRQNHEDHYQEIVRKHLRRADDSEDAKSTITDKAKEEQLLAQEATFKSKLNQRNKI